MGIEPLSKKDCGYVYGYRKMDGSNLRTTSNNYLFGMHPPLLGWNGGFAVDALHWRYFRCEPNSGHAWRKLSCGCYNWKMAWSIALSASLTLIRTIVSASVFVVLFVWMGNRRERE